MTSDLRGFSRLWTSHMISMIGDWLSYTAVLVISEIMQEAFDAFHIDNPTWTREEWIPWSVEAKSLKKLRRNSCGVVSILEGVFFPVESCGEVV